MAQESEQRIPLGTTASCGYPGIQQRGRAFIVGVLEGAWPSSRKDSDRHSAAE